MKRRLWKRDELDRIAPVEALLERAPQPVCGSAVRDEVRGRVMAGLTLEEPAGRRARGRRVHDRAVGRGKLPRATVVRRAVLVPAIVLVLLAAMTAGAYALSAGANPDSALYPVKLFFERARFEMTGSDLARAELGLEYAEKRMAELEFMVSNGISDGASDWLDEYEGNLLKAQEYTAKLQGDAAVEIQIRLGQLAEEHLQLMQSLSLRANFDLSPAIVRVQDVVSEIGLGGLGGGKPATPSDGGSPGSTNAAPGTPGTSGNSSAATPPGEVYSSPVDGRTYDEGTEAPEVPSDNVPGDGNSLYPSDPYSIPSWPWPSLEWWHHLEADQGAGSPSWP